MALLDDVKDALRVDGNDSDTEISDLIAAAKADLALSGVDPSKAQDEGDPLIRRAIITYCRAHFDVDDWVFERLVQAYNMLKAHLSLAEDYRAGGGS